MNRWINQIKSAPAVRKSAVIGLLILIGFAILAPVIANNQPLYCTYEGNHYFPVFGDYPASILNEYEQPETFDWRVVNLDYAIWPPIAYSPDFMDPFNRKYVSPLATQKLKNDEMPGRWRHYLGTDRIGRDTAAGLVHGMRISLMIALFSAFLAGFIGLIAGGLAGFYANRRVHVHLFTVLISIIGLLLWLYVSLLQPYYSNGTPKAFQFIIGILIGGGLLWVLNKLLLRRNQKVLTFAVNPDGIVMRIIEITNSVPKFLIILSIAAITAKSLTTVILIIGFTGWAEIARLFRAEVLKARESEFVEAANSIGLSQFRILVRHIAPNALGPASIAIAFAAASAILTESALSFLGIGVPEGDVTWGKMLQLGRANLEAWWLIIPPGIMILVSVFIFQNIARK